MLAFGYRLIKEKHYQLLKTANTLANAEGESIKLKNARLFHQVIEQGLELKKLKHSIACYASASKARNRKKKRLLMRARRKKGLA